MENISVFAKYLDILSSYNIAVDLGRCTPENFIEFQRMESKIIRAYQIGYFGKAEYKILTNLYYFVKDGYRLMLCLN